MRPSATTAFTLAFGLALGAASHAQAQRIPSPYRYIEKGIEAGPIVGYVSSATGRFGFGPKGGLLTGVRWGIELAGPISFETTAGVIPGTRDIVSPARAEGDRVVGEADALMTTVDARLKFSVPGRRTWHRLSPFLVVGGGLAMDLAGEAPDDDLLEAEDRFEFGTSFFGTTGVGTRLFVTDRLSLRTDALFQLWQIDTPPGWAEPDRGFTGVEESEWVSGYRLSVSATIRW